MDAEQAKPEPVDLSHHLSQVTRARHPSAVKDFYKYFQIPGIGNFAGGMPNHSYFPFDTLEASTALPGRFAPTPNRAGDAAAAAAAAGVPAAHLLVPHEAAAADLAHEIDVKTALQYGTAEGYAPLVEFVRRFTRTALHPNVPYRGGPEVALTCGNTDGMAKVVEALTDAWRPGRDPRSERQGLLCEEFAYATALQTVQPRGLNVAPVRVDGQGMLAEGPGGLRDVLEDWDPRRGRKPHLMYTVTVGQNPTTGTLGVARRRALYALCARHDVVIVEDDPYWYLQFPSAAAHNDAPDPPGSRNFNTPKSSGFAFLDSLVPSYLSLDTEGRVVRLDTFSKTVAPGCRLGWLTAQPALVERFVRIAETSTQQPSGFVQAVVAQLVRGQAGPAWELAGWVRWLEGLRGNYERRMNAMCAALDAGRFRLRSGRRPSLDGPPAGDSEGWAVVSKTPMYSFAWPLGGMFVWVRVLFENHPLAAAVAGPDLSQAFWAFLTTEPHLVLVAPGHMFSPNDQIRAEKGWRFFRLCFAAVDEHDVEPITQRFVSGVAAFWRVKDLERIRSLRESEAAQVAARGGLRSLAGGGGWTC